MTREELVALIQACDDNATNKTAGSAADRILAALEEEREEPLAGLADRKGVSVEITPPSFYQTEGEGWDIGVAVPWEGVLYPFDSPTYAECEAKARAFLAGLPDRPTKGGE